MKKSKIILLSNVLFTILIVTACSGSKNSAVQNTTTHKYKDGVYSVKTDYDGEKYYSKAEITIKGDKITNVVYNIYDQNDRVFDKTYEEVFAGSELYIQQCRDDLKGLSTYTPKLIDTQDITKVDAVSGATWANNKFKEAISLALEKAK